MSIYTFPFGLAALALLPVDAVAACGDGDLDLNEAARETCDDGNTAGDDGCSATCQVELDWGCSDEPSVCRLVPNFLYATGVDDSGNEGVSGTIDLHWLNDGGPATLSAGASPFTQVPGATWLGEDGCYSQDLDLPSVAGIAGATLTLAVSADDEIDAVLINGTDVGVTLGRPAYTTTQFLTIPAGDHWQPGLNEVEICVLNSGGGPTG
ncbi:MAG: cysteine-rich repeat protein, partial [Myxococcota bacterium]